MDTTLYDQLLERIKALELRVDALEGLSRCSTPPIIYTGASKPPKTRSPYEPRPCKPNPISFRRGDSQC